MFKYMSESYLCKISKGVNDADSGQRLVHFTTPFFILYSLNDLIKVIYVFYKVLGHFVIHF